VRDEHRYPREANDVFGDAPALAQSREPASAAASVPGIAALVLARLLRGLGYDVRINEGYKGVEIVRRYGRPAERRHSLQIEIKRTLYMDESTLVPNAGYARLEADLRRLAHALADYVRGQLRWKGQRDGYRPDR